MLKSFKNPNVLTEYNYVPVDKFTRFSDEEIISKIIEGSTPLFEVIIRRYNQRLFRIQRSYISDENAIKDTLQITYLKVFENLEKFRGESLFSTWITRIAINEALKYVKREKHYSEMQVLNESEIDYECIVNGTNTPENNMVRDDLRNLLEKTVNQLPPKYRAVYIMREVEEMSIRETADCLQISKVNVKTRLHRARQMVREALERKVADTKIFNFLGHQCDEVVYRVMCSI